ncbi:hypothetical protein QBC33DRAFT_597252 [Phialemonium atrogriseum]|uniref:Uncharacterized protein n=1 Tax=Phialemonium atrogriseum TaxID=1093897 RepID=A0AAJ0C5Z8_9PEZI|nr:uncharacterized protein QBC33DRAFT_597252 [Phialemonium atrogriseum]KAK1770795.1 hypothetical protein QBC33DRAFT_597252 [Phialemonium atrogriseum]
MAVNRHFWNLDEVSSNKIATIFHKGENYNKEGVIWHAWEEIPRVYLPTQSVVLLGDRYSVVREPYRRPVGAQGQDDDEHLPQVRPDVVTVRHHNIQPQQGIAPLATERDVLWIECKAPIHNSPFEWKNLMFEATHRLAISYSPRKVYFILAIGLKWMPFVWDPTMPGQNPI